MFLSKCANGIYYIYFIDTKGVRQGISTKSKKKSDALIFLSNFEQNTKKINKNTITDISLNNFSLEFLKHSEAIHTPKTTKTFVTTFRYIENFLENIQLNDITERDIRKYIDFRINNPSIYQARKDSYII